MRGKNWIRGAAMGGVGAMAFATAAAAQTTGQAEASAYSIVDTPAVAQMSSHYSLNGTFETEYQTNVAGGNAAIAALRGLKQSDVIFTPTALIEAFKPFGRESIFLVGSTGYNFYDRNTVLNRETFDLSGGINAQLSACRATVTGGYVRRQNELLDVTRTSVKDVLSQPSVGLEGTCGRGFGFSPNFSITQSWSTNTLTQLRTSDYNTLGGSAGITYQTPTVGSLSFFGQYQTTDFTNRLLVINLSPTHDGFDTYGGGVRYVRELGARIQGTVSLSYTSVQPFIGGATGFNGPTYGADITYRASSRLTLHGDVLRDIQPSNVFDATYFIETKELVEATYHAGSRLDFLLGASELDRSFKGVALSRNIDLTSDAQKSIYATATYKLRKFYLALNVSYVERSANLAGLDYPDTHVGLTAGTSF